MKKIYLITLIIIVFQGNIPAQTNLNSGLVLYYPFNGNANDLSGNEINGTVYGTILTSDRFGNINSAYSFDGINDYIIASSILPVGNSSRSISVWFKTTSSSGSNGWYNNTAISWGAPKNNNLCSIAIYVGKLMFGAFGTENDVHTDQMVNNGIWNHVVVTYDGLVLRIFLNGVQIASENRNLNTISSNFYIGRRVGQENQYMNGSIDDIRIYNRTLTSQEIDSLFRLESVTNPVGDQVLFEDFEDNVLDSRINVIKKGTFNSAPSIKNITNFGSLKAFGFGRSTCAANCFDSYVTNFKINLLEPTYVSSLSFKEMELFGNWGSKGKIYIDGSLLNAGGAEIFGRQPSNDRNPDINYRSRNIILDRYVTTIELKVEDITSSSEIFIDDIGLFVIDDAASTPVPPKDLKITVEGDKTTLTWSPNSESDLKLYRIYRNLTSPPATLIDSVPAGINTYIDSLNDEGKTYFYRITAIDRYYNESNFSNEVSTFRQKLPDLKVILIEAPAEISSGQTLSVTWQVNNIGEEGTQIPEWFDRVYLSPSADFDPDNSTILGTFENFSYLAANEAYRNTAQFIIPRDLFGTHYIHVLTDANNNLHESSEENNTGRSDVFMVNLSPFADLEVLKLNASDIAFSGDTIEITWTVKNTGTIKTEKEKWFDRIYLSEDNNFEIVPTLLQGVWRINETPLGVLEHIGILEPDSSYTSSIKIRLPHKISGTYHIFVHADALEDCSIPQHPEGFFIVNNNDIYEFNQEFDNWSSKSIDVILSDLPDLVVTDIKAPIDASLGEEIKIEWTVHNKGLNNTFESTWSDRIYISSAPAFDITQAKVLGTYPKTGILGRDSSYSKKVTVKIPDGFPDSNYIYIKTDYNDQVFENEFEDNNIARTDTKIDINNPDFTIAEITAPVNTSSGKIINIGWEVLNQGEGSMYNGLWSDCIYLSKYSAFNADSVKELGKYSRSGSVLKDSAYVIQKNVQLPNGIEGPYYIFVRTDVYNQVYEPNFEDNNIEHSVSPIQINLSPWPDLTVASTTSPEEGQAGQRISVTWDVKNEGQASVTGSSWTDKIFLSTNKILDQEAHLLKSVESSRTINPSSGYSQPALVTLSTDLSGTYYIFVVTDADNTVYEHSDEGNNTSVADTITIKSYPPIDLIVSGFSVPDSGLSGLPINLQWSVKNIGTGKTLVSTWSDALYLSSDAQLNKDEDILIKKIAHSGFLQPEESYSRYENINLPDLPGDFYIIIQTDIEDNAGDINFGNNHFVSTNPVSITLTPRADLQITSVTTSPTATAGQPATIHFRTENKGLGPTYANRWYDAFYLSADPVFDNSDIHLGTYTKNGEILSRVFYNDSLEVEIPVYANGSYFLIARTDIRDDVYERNGEDNNSRTIPVFITVPPPADLIVKNIVVPDRATPGEEITVSWTVENIGENAAVGRMRDAVYISADENWQVEDPLLGVVTREINIAQGKTVKSSTQFRLAKTYKADAEGNIIEELPGVIPGTYHAIVRTDIRNNIRENNIYNNTGISNNLISTDIPILEIGVTADGTLLNGQSVYYRIENSIQGKTLKISLQSKDKDATNEMYLKFEDIPNKVKFDFKNEDPFSADQIIIVPLIQAGTSYLMLNNIFSNLDSLQYSLTAQIIDFRVESIDIHEGGQGGNITIGITGSSFKQNIEVSLENNKTTLQASEIYYFDATQIFATFDLNKIPVGIYDLKFLQDESYFEYYDDLNNPIEFVKDSNFVILQNTFSVVEPSNTPLEICVDGPSHARAGNQIQININVINKSNNDILAPILMLHGIPDFESRFYDEKLLGPYRFVAISETGPAGILRPDSRNTIKMQVKAPIIVDTLKIRINTMEELGLDFDFNRELSVVGLSPTSVWQDAIDLLSTKLDNGWSDYHKIIANTVTRFKLDGYLHFDYRSLILGSIKKEMQETVMIDSSEIFFENSIYYGPELDRIENSKFKSSPNCDEKVTTAQVAALLGIADLWGVFGMPTASEHMQRFLYNVGGSAVYNNFSDVSRAVRRTKTGIERSYEDVHNVVRSKVIDVLSDEILALSNKNEEIEINDFILLGIENEKPSFWPLNSVINLFEGGSNADLFFGIGGMQKPTKVLVRDIDVKIPSINECQDRTAYFSATLDYQFYDYYEYQKADAFFAFTEWARNLQLCGSAKPFHVYVRISEWISDYVNLPASTSEECCQDDNDIDCDDIPNDQDEDIDGDHIPNKYDDDIDGDGKKNWDDDDMDGDGIPNIQDPDIDGDGIPNTQDPDIDGDGIPNTQDADIDGDGIPNNEDPDMDGDGIPNGEDDDMDGDGIPNNEDPEPAGPTRNGQGTDIPIGQPIDPNEIIGPKGFRDNQWITKDQILPYTINFENDSSLASASAQFVKISQKLDSTLDARTFRLGSFGFGNYVFNILENNAFYTQRLDLRDSLGFFVDVSAGIDITKNEIFWQFKSIDPATEELPGFEGFLPVNDALGKGQGFVNYTISPREDSHTGDIVNAQAEIVFDKNAPMLTNSWFNTIDADPPVSSVLPLGVSQDSGYFMVEWSGTDIGSGITDYSIYSSSNNEPVILWNQNNPYTSDIFIAKDNGEHGFYSIARDGAGNIEVPPHSFDAVTNVIIGIEDIDYVPDNISLSQNYPNPFGTTTTIRYHLNARSNVQLNIYDISGRKIKTLVNQNQDSGEYSISFEASGLQSGIYIYQLKTGSFTKSRKMILLR